MKKLISVIMAVAMMISMSVVSFAATTLPAPVAGVITLTEDVVLTETFVVSGGESIVLDLNGHTVSMEDSSSATAALIKNEGTLTIKDSATGGTLSFKTTTPSASNSYASNTISNYGVLTVESGTIENNSVGGACYALDNYAGSTATILGGKLTAEKTAVRIFNWTEGDAAKATLNIEGGEIIGEDGYGINLNMGNAPQVEVNIKGGTITTNDTDYNLAVYVVSKGSAENVVINVTDGEFNGNFALNGLTSTTMADGNISVSGGEFEGVICYDTPNYAFVSGGTFSDTLPTEYLFPGKIQDKNNGTVREPLDPTVDCDLDGASFATGEAYEFTVKVSYNDLDTEITPLDLFFALDGSNVKLEKKNGDEWTEVSGNEITIIGIGADVEYDFRVTCSEEGEYTYSASLSKSSVNGASYIETYDDIDGSYVVKGVADNSSSGSSSGSSSAPSSRPSRDDDDDDDDEGITDIVPGNKKPEGEENPNTGAPIMLPIATAAAALCGLYISKKK